MVLSLPSVEGPAEIAALSADRRMFVASDALVVDRWSPPAVFGGQCGPLRHGIDPPYTLVDSMRLRCTRLVLRGATNSICSPLVRRISREEPPYFYCSPGALRCVRQCRLKHHMNDLNPAYTMQRTNTDGAIGAVEGTIFFRFPIVDWLESKESLEAIASKSFFGRLPTPRLNIYVRPVGDQVHPDRFVAAHPQTKQKGEDTTS